MDAKRLTEQCQEALQRAHALAVRHNHQGVDCAHLLAALLEEPEGLAAGTFAATGIAPIAVREKVEQELARMPQVSGPEEQKLSERGGMQLLKQEVDEDDIAAVVSRWTGIPVAKLLEGEKEKLLHLPNHLHKRIVGQEEAVDAVADAAREHLAVE